MFFVDSGEVISAGHKRAERIATAPRERIMIRARTALLLLLIACSMPAFAEEALTAEKRADIEKLLEMTGALSIGRQMSGAVVQQMTEFLRKARPDIPQRVLDVLPEEVDAVIMDNMRTFKDMSVPLYHKYYTGAEVKEMIRFYSTPLGKKTIETMPAIMNEGFQLGQKWGQSLGPAIQARVQARLKKEGYDLEQKPKTQ
jgi:hypothetical protein